MRQEHSRNQVFRALLGKARGSGIGVVMAHQSLGDFGDPLVGKQILDNTESLFSFVQKDPESCDILASVAGTRESVKKTVQTERRGLFEQKTGSGSERDVHEFRVSPNVFRDLNVGEAVYIAKKPSRHGIVSVFYG